MQTFVAHDDFPSLFLFVTLVFTIISHNANSLLPFPQQRLMLWKRRLKETRTKEIKDGGLILALDGHQHFKRFG